MNEFIVNSLDGKKYCVINKFVRTFESQEEFTKWEKEYGAEFLVYQNEVVYICYEVKDAEFEDIQTQSLTVVPKNEDEVQTV